MQQHPHKTQTNKSSNRKGISSCDPYIRFVITEKVENDPRSNNYLNDAHELGLIRISKIKCEDLYFIDGELNNDSAQQIAKQLLCDPVTQTYNFEAVKQTDQKSANTPQHQSVVEVALLPGVTDPVAEQIIRVSRMLGIKGVEKVATGKRFTIESDAINDIPLDTLAGRLLYNPVIQRYAIGKIEPNFPNPAQSSGKVKKINVRDMNDEELITFANERLSSLDIHEMRAIQNYYRKIERDMSDVEFEMIAQTWSEHCVHKTFSARIELEDENGDVSVVDNILNTYIRSATETINAPWVLSAFIDNAGIIEFDEQNDISFKVETHNHPSAIEPFGGANTGIGGVIRDVIGVSAKPIAATDILCFGPQDLPLDQLSESILHPKRIQSGVVAGIQDYGNKIGIPTVNGAILYDEGFTANPLVYCGCIGIAPRGSHPRKAQPGDHLIIIGGRTGRDGLRGATFSSMTMDAKTGEVFGASVQIGAPITEKGLIEVTTKARDQYLYSAITDCGAGGLSSAIGEMTKDLGAVVELSRVKLKYAGLAPWEIWLSEAQERMVLAVPDDKLSDLMQLCNIYDVELTDVGWITDSGELIIHYKDNIVLELSNEFLHKGIPQKQLKAKKIIKSKNGFAHSRSVNKINYEECLLDLLSHPNVASKEAVIRVYDHEVQGGTIVKPLTGQYMDAPSDGCVIKPIGTHGTKGIVISNGINPEFGKVNTYRMAMSVIDEAIRNCVVVGADPDRIALLDNFCWGNPNNPETLGSLIEAARGCYNAATFFKTPFISGKDSLNNEYIGSDGLSHSIPPTLLISAIGIIDDVSTAITMDLKHAGNSLYLLGKMAPFFGGSHINLICDHDIIRENHEVPDLPPYTNDLYKKLYEANKNQWVLSCHDSSEGGLSVAAAEMCIGGRLGLKIELNVAEPFITLFAENNGCLLVEVDKENSVKFEELLGSLPYLKLGVVTDDPILKILNNNHPIVNLDLDILINKWKRDPLEIN